MMVCEHENFSVNADIGRLSMVDGGPITHYCADVSVSCADCGQKFQFVGLPLGCSAYRPTVSMDGLELRAPLMPEGVKVPDGIPGFDVRIGDTEQ